MKTFLAELARAVDAAPARDIPRWLVTLAAPVMAEFGCATLTLANDRIKRALGWKPRYPTVETGLAEMRRLASEAA